MEFLQDMLTVAAFSCQLYAAMILVFGLWHIATRHTVQAPTHKGITATTLAPIFEPIAVPAKKSTLSDSIRQEVAPTGIRALRQQIRDRKLQTTIKERTGKTVSRCTLTELQTALLEVAA